MKLYKKIAPYIAAVYLFSAAPIYCQEKKIVYSKSVLEKFRLEPKPQSNLENLMDLYSKKPQRKKSKSFIKNKWFWISIGLISGGAYYYEKHKKKDKPPEPITNSDDKDDDQDPGHPLSLRLEKRF